MQIDFEEAIVHLRDLLHMSKSELQEAVAYEHKLRDGHEQSKRPNLIIHAFRRKFDKNTKDPSVALAARAKVKTDPYGRVR
jgi:hypothetical protein